MDGVAARNGALLAWFDRAGRRLPWRETTDPWAILVSEVMLQQTQVSRVVPAFEAFMARHPTPDDFARLPSAAVIEAWGGLGYLRRAFRLQEAAARIAADGWPEPDALSDLPGVGAYTAAAVGSIAFGHQVPSVDTNLRRVLSRWHGRDLSGSTLTDAAHDSLGTEPADRWNQAMMDLGATLCRPRRPRCEDCPVQAWCLDPGVVPEARRQSPFEGSVRQARAAILKTLAVSGPIARQDLAPRLELAEDRVEQALEALAGELLVVVEDGAVRLA